MNGGQAMLRIVSESERNTWWMPLAFGSPSAVMTLAGSDTASATISRTARWLSFWSTALRQRRTKSSISNCIIAILPPSQRVVVGLFCFLRCLGRRVDLVRRGTVDAVEHGRRDDEQRTGDAVDPGIDVEAKEHHDERDR